MENKISKLEHGNSIINNETKMNTNDCVHIKRVWNLMIKYQKRFENYRTDLDTEMIWISNRQKADFLLCR